MGRIDLGNTNSLRDANPEHPALGCAMPVISTHDGDVRCVGTSFLVLPGLAITADHVVEDCLQYQQRRDGYKREDAVFSINTLSLSDGHIYEWSVEALYGSRSAHIAFLQFRKPGWWGGSFTPSYPRLNFNPPRVGHQVRIFGFTQPILTEGVLSISAVECLANVRTIVIKNDARLRPLSYVELDAETRCGMSGGPCFDKEWNVVGMHSNGLTDSESTPLAYMALIWPAMGVPIDHFKTGAFPVFDLFKDGKAQALGYERVIVKEGGVSIAPPRRSQAAPQESCESGHTPPLPSAQCRQGPL